MSCEVDFCFLSCQQFKTVHAIRPFPHWTLLFYSPEKIYTLKVRNLYTFSCVPNNNLLGHSQLNEKNFKVTE